MCSALHERTLNGKRAQYLFSHRTHRDVPSLCVFYFLTQKESSMTKRKDTKAKAFTCRGAAALITAALLTAALLLTGCPQSIENKPNIPSGPDPNLRIEGGVLKGYNEPPSGALVIPAGVTEIAGSAFSGCTSLTQVNFPASLTKIGSYAFYGCTGLTSLTLPASLETLEYSVFFRMYGNKRHGSFAGKS